MNEKKTQGETLVIKTLTIEWVNEALVAGPPFV